MKKIFSIFFNTKRRAAYSNRDKRFYSSRLKAKDDIIKKLKEENGALINTAIKQSKKMVEVRTELEELRKKTENQ